MHVLSGGTSAVHVRLHGHLDWGKWQVQINASPSAVSNPDGWTAVTDGRILNLLVILKIRRALLLSPVRIGWKNGSSVVL